MSTEKPLHHQANVVRITEIKKHSNADKLELVYFSGSNYQCVSQIGAFKVGDLAIFIQPDSVVPETETFRFVWCTGSDPAGVRFGNEAVPERSRRITVKRLRKEWSEGLLMPISDFPQLFDDSVGFFYIEGQDVSDEIGITHYDADNVEGTVGEDSHAPRIKRRKPRTFTGWLKYFFYKVFGYSDKTADIKLDIPVYDVDNLRNARRGFRDGDWVVVTEKIHGSNARYVFLEGTMYAGSKNLWKHETSNCLWRKALKTNPWIEEWCRNNEGLVLYGEVTPTQKGYEYGSKDVQFFPFSVRNPDGSWAPTHPNYWTSLPSRVPILYIGPWDQEVLSQYVDGPSTVFGASHIREGIVATVLSTEPAHALRQYKLKSNAFLEKEGRG